AMMLTALNAAAPASDQDSSVVIVSALRAAPPSIAEHAAVVDWAGNELRKGTNGWVCFPDPPEMEAASMCLDGPWQAWAGAWQNRQPVPIRHAGIAYMLMGDARSEEHTSELESREKLVCRLLLDKKNN